MSADRSAPTQRLTAARDAYADAVRAERVARVEAAPALRSRARHRRSALRLFTVAAVVAAVVLAGIAAWACVSAGSTRETADAADRARIAAADAVTAMLTADPADADGYVRAVVDLSSGPQRSRLEAAGPQLAATVAALDGRQHGTVIASGVRDASDARADVLVVAQASDPRLVGGDVGARRIGLLVTMIRDGDRWLVEQTEKVS